MHGADAGVQAVTPRLLAAWCPPMRRRALGWALAAVAGVVFLAPLDVRAQGTCALPSASGRLCVGVEPLSTPKVGTYSNWKVRVADRNGRPADVSLSVRGGMPAHGHGLPSKPAVRRLATGEFLVEGLLFNMMGEWVIRFDAVADGAGLDTAIHRLQLAQ